MYRQKNNEYAKTSKWIIKGHGYILTGAIPAGPIRNAALDLVTSAWHCHNYCWPCLIDPVGSTGLLRIATLPPHAAARVAGQAADFCAIGLVVSGDSLIPCMELSDPLRSCEAHGDDSCCRLWLYASSTEEAAWRAVSATASGWWGSSSYQPAGESRWPGALTIFKSRCAAVRSGGDGITGPSSCLGAGARSCPDFGPARSGCAGCAAMVPAALLSDIGHRH